jgi:L-ascorbate metabolism protein UlaG (beta-lactamase superfamily)
MIDPWIKGATKLPDEFKDLNKLGKVDLILVTHGHGDHLGDAMEISKTNDVPMWASIQVIDAEPGTKKEF